MSFIGFRDMASLFITRALLWLLWLSTALAKVQAFKPKYVMYMTGYVTTSKTSGSIDAIQTAQCRAGADLSRERDARCTRLHAVGNLQ
jgi:hypothetical protein